MKNMEISLPVTRDTILKLIDKKDEIEAELRELKKILDANNIGMSEQLVDEEGYPRNDIDVYQVRQARHKIIRLQNDHKQLMAEIELSLHHFHSNSVPDNKESNSDSETSAPKVEASPFAKIVHVDNGSPADLAGLQDGDLVVSFGSINFDNFKSMQDIASVVEHCVGRSVAISIRRGKLGKSLTLFPKEWKGKGLLGCVILELDNIEK